MTNQTTPFVNHFTVEPGNMTRYELLFVEYTDCQYNTPRCGFTWLSKGASGETFVWAKGSTIYSSYACEKSNIHRTDLIAILYAIKKMFPDSIETIVGFEDYDENGLYRGLTC